MLITCEPLIPPERTAFTAFPRCLAGAYLCRKRGRDCGETLPRRIPAGAVQPREISRQFLVRGVSRKWPAPRRLPAGAQMDGFFVGIFFAFPHWSTILSGELRRVAVTMRGVLHPICPSLVRSVGVNVLKSMTNGISLQMDPMRTKKKNEHDIRAQESRGAGCSE